MRGVPDCVADRVWFAVPQPTEWQRIGNQIDAAMIFAGAHFVNVHPSSTVRFCLPPNLRLRLSSGVSRESHRLARVLVLACSLGLTRPLHRTHKFDTH